MQANDLLMRKLQISGGEAMGDLLGELSAIVTKVEASNDPAFGTTAPREALAGATPYLYLFSVTVGGCMLAKEALAARNDEPVQGDTKRYATLARFFAENLTMQAGALERSVIDSTDAVNGPDAVLVA